MASLRLDPHKVSRGTFSGAMTYFAVALLDTADMTTTSTEETMMPNNVGGLIELRARSGAITVKERTAS